MGTKPLFELRTIVRGGSAKHRGWIENFCGLVDQQPMLLVPEPLNPVDSHAVRVHDLHNNPCGYVAREHAPLVVAQFEAGRTPMARMVGRCRCDYRRIYIWVDGEADAEIEARITMGLPVRRVRELERA